MYYSKKNQAEEIPNQMTAVWSCTQDDCNGWMREDFSFETIPTCWRCQSPMEKSMKSLPVLNNNQWQMAAKGK
ncbi:cold-shock protein [Paenibacillus turpanensis]|uniref:cold-shock protein n=1 Tax=Paenibacillus turpanensis TaxID=2689078 RepID=UPI00140B82A4|nr:cold-shock protein [Paenibacillus turpanensis]